jgi:hypothetical protein
MDNSSPSTGEPVVTVIDTASLDARFAELEASWRETTDPDGDGPERRGSTRLNPLEFAADLRLRVAGFPMRLVNLSSTGLLAETPHRLCPGRTVDLFLRHGATRRVIKAVVVRSTLHALTPQPLFRAALQFEEELQIPAAG